MEERGLAPGGLKIQKLLEENNDQSLIIEDKLIEHQEELKEDHEVELTLKRGVKYPLKWINSIDTSTSTLDSTNMNPEHELKVLERFLKSRNPNHPHITNEDENSLLKDIMTLILHYEKNKDKRHTFDDLTGEIKRAIHRFCMEKGIAATENITWDSVF